LLLIHRSAWNRNSRKFTENTALKAARFIGNSSQRSILAPAEGNPLAQAVQWKEATLSCKTNKQLKNRS
jgi:hypothetical protein